MADTRCAMPTADTRCAMTTPTQQRLYHQVEVIVKSTTETTSRWAPQSTAVVFTHITSRALNELMSYGTCVVGVVVKTTIV